MLGADAQARIDFVTAYPVLPTMERLQFRDARLNCREKNVELGVTDPVGGDVEVLELAVGGKHIGEFS